MGIKQSKSLSTSSAIINPITEAIFILSTISLIRISKCIGLSRFVIGNDQGNLIIYNKYNGVKIIELNKHSNPITCILTINNERIVTGDTSGCVNVYY